MPASWLVITLWFGVALVAASATIAHGKHDTMPMLNGGRAPPIATPAYSARVNYTAGDIGTMKVDTVNQGYWLSQWDKVNLCYNGLTSHLNLKKKHCDPKGLDGTCFHNPLAFVNGQNLEYQGLDTLEGGIIADKWLKVPSSLFNQRLVWVVPNTTGTSAVFLQVCDASYPWTFVNYTVEEAGFIKEPAECAHVPGIITPLYCPLAPVVAKTVYRLHPSNNYTLLNTNVADLLGDVTFMVSLSMGGSAWPDSKIFSAFNVSVNETYGEYHRCNPIANGNFECAVDVQQEVVGRQVPAEIGHVGGLYERQCAPANATEFGEWFSFPAAANNPQGWMVLNRIKSVTMGCLAKLGLRDLLKHTSLSNNTLAPVAALLEKGLQVCPDTPPPGQ